MISICKFCKKNKKKKIVDNIKDFEFGVPGVYSYEQCQFCKLITLNPFPKKDEIKNFYPKNYISYLKDSSKKGVIYYILEKIYNFLFLSKLKDNIKINSSLLDVGGGNGDFLKYIEQENCDLNLIDFDRNVCAIAEAKSINSFCGFFLDYNEKKNFDYIFMNNYIEHVIDPVKEIQKAYELLKKGGKLVGVTPNFDSYDQKLFGKYWGGNHIPRHTYQYSPEVLKEILEKNNFKDIIISYDINPSHLVLSLQNFLYKNKLNKLKNGRSKFYNIWLIVLLPINYIFKICKGSGIMTFSATK